MSAQPKQIEAPAQQDRLPEELTPRQRTWRRAIKNLKKKKVTIAGVIIVCLVAFCAIFAPLIAPHDPVAQSLESKLMPPAWMAGGTSQYLLGTDHLGRDILSRLIYGSQISLLVGLTAVLISGGIGTVLGLIGGYYRGFVDDVVGRLGDIQLAFPFTLLALAVMAALGTGLWKTIAVLGIAGWVIYARIMRSEVLALRERDFVSAARALGNTDRAIIFQHILPNAIASLIVISTLEVPRVIIAESALTFLGLGIQPPTVTWGGMLADARNYITTHWWVAVFPGLALQITVLGLNLVGDWLRDTLDPRIKD